MNGKLEQEQDLTQSRSTIRKHVSKIGSRQNPTHIIQISMCDVQTGLRIFWKPNNILKVESHYPNTLVENQMVETKQIFDKIHL